MLWGIDLGGTKIEGVILASTSPDSVVLRKRIDTEAQHGYQHIIGQIAKLIGQMEAETGQKAEKLGIATPGTLDPNTNKLKNSNTVCLNGTPFKDDLEAAINIPVIIANDANCFALAEATMGVVPDVLADFRCVFGVIMGTGVGGGVILKSPDGQVFQLGGLHGIGGEWGHNELETNGYDCYCGKKGCTEQVLSGPALQKFYREQSGKDLTLKQIMLNYETGNDQAATATVDRMLEYFGKGLSTITNILDPDAIVIGGGVGNIDLFYNEGVERLRKHIFNTKQINTPILKPKLGDSAGVFGAAMLTV